LQKNKIYKKLEENSKTQMSLQRHRQRDEHWQIPGVTARITIDGKLYILTFDVKLLSLSINSRKRRSQSYI
jgi:hypothetical protein